MRQLAVDRAMPSNTADLYLRHPFVFLDVSLDKPLEKYTSFVVEKNWGAKGHFMELLKDASF